MRPDDLAQALAPERFRPFTLKLTSGETFPITHPDQIIVGRSTIAIGTQRRNRSRMYERVITAGLVHVVSLTPLEETAVN